MDAIQRSWLLKLAWLLVPFVPITAIAIGKHSKAGGSSDLIAILPLLLAFIGLLLPFAISLAERPAKQARRRALPPLQRMQMSDETDAVSLTDALRIAENPPVDSLPRPLQLIIARFGAPLPRALSSVIRSLGLIAWLMAIAMVVMDDPVGSLSGWLSRPLPLSYWPTYAAFMMTAIIVALWQWLRQLQDHYAAAAKASGRRPFPALR